MNGRGRVAGPRATAALVVLTGLLVTLAGCRSTTGPADAPGAGAAPAGTAVGGGSTGGEATGGEATGGAPIPGADLAAIRATLDAVNATAGGPVAAQQAQLLARTDPDRRGEVQRCPPPTTTVLFEPVERGLRYGTPAASGAEPTAGSGGTTYQWPALIRIYAGDRVVGTDLTTLQVIVRPGGTGVEAYLTPFCVN